MIAAADRTGSRAGGKCAAPCNGGPSRPGCVCERAEARHGGCQCAASASRWHLCASCVVCVPRHALCTEVPYVWTRGPLVRVVCGAPPTKRCTPCAHPPKCALTPAPVSCCLCPCVCVRAGHQAAWRAIVRTPVSATCVHSPLCSVVLCHSTRHGPEGQIRRVHAGGRAIFSSALVSAGSSGGSRQRTANRSAARSYGPERAEGDTQVACRVLHTLCKRVHPPCVCGARSGVLVCVCVFGGCGAKERHRTCRRSDVPAQCTPQVHCDAEASCVLANQRRLCGCPRPGVLDCMPGSPPSAGGRSRRRAATGDQSVARWGHARACAPPVCVCGTAPVPRVVLCR